MNRPYSCCNVRIDSYSRNNQFRLAGSKGLSPAQSQVASHRKLASGEKTGWHVHRSWTQFWDPTRVPIPNKTTETTPLYVSASVRASHRQSSQALTNEAAIYCRFFCGDNFRLRLGYSRTLITGISGSYRNNTAKKNVCA